MKDRRLEIPQSVACGLQAELYGRIGTIKERFKA